MDVVVWLRSLGLEEYEAAFRENKINERVLPNLTQEDLKEIGVGPVGHRRILLEAIAALRAETGGKASSADAATTSTDRAAGDRVAVAVDAHLHDAQLERPLIAFLAILAAGHGSISGQLGPERLSGRSRGAPPSHGDVLGPCGLYGPLGPPGP